MDTKRLPASEFEKKAEQAFEKYKILQPDLVILCDHNALKYLGQKFIKTKTPVVFLGINNNPRDYHIINGSKNITGVLERHLMKRSIIYLNKIIKPKPKKILIMVDSGVTSRAAVKEIFNDRNSIFLSGIQVDLKMIKDLSTWKNSVLNAKKLGYDTIVIGLYQTIVDDNNNHVNSSKIIEWTSKNTPVPPFALWEIAVGCNLTIGGLVMFGKTQGETAAKMALRILSEEKPESIPVIVGEKGQLFFCKFQLKKWKLTIPSDLISRVKFCK